MVQHRPLLLASVLLTVVFGSVAFVHFQTKNLDRFRPSITKSLERITSHPASLKKLSYAPLSGLFTLALEELELLSQDPSEPPMVQVHETLLSFSPLSFFTGKPQLSSIKFINPQINLVLRDHSPLMERAQDTALASDEKLLAELGVRLADITIGRITVQNGMLVILDWDHPEGRTWVFDHLQLGIHALSPMRASPITASARYRSIPFTVTGQVGPLPETLDPFEMPILLSLEAKSIGLKDVLETISTETIQVSTSRGYFTTLLHGSLAKGLQTSTLLQLDGVNLSRKDEKTKKERKPLIKPDILDRFNKRNEKKTIDLALRQKSTLHMGWEGAPKLEFEEFFVYVDNSPILETTGWIRNQWRGPLDLEMKILNKIDLDRLPWPDLFPFKGQGPSGSFKFAGIWPTTMTYSANLDLSQTTIELPPLNKKANSPLALKFLISQVRDQITIKEFLLHHPIIPDQTIKIAGPLTPTMKLVTSLNWHLDDAPNYFPTVKNWNAKGLAKLNMELGQTKESSNWLAKGTFQAKQGKIGPIEFQELQIPFAIEDEQLRLPHMRIVSAGGRVEILAMADLSQDPVIFDSRINLAGMDLSQLPGQKEGNDSVRLEGYMFAEASIQGQLDKDTFLPTDNLFGHTHLRVEPGRLNGIDQNAFYKRVTKETVISNEKKSLYWNIMQADIELLNKKLTLENIQVDNAEAHISGKGFWDLAGDRRFDLDIKTDWDSQRGYKKRFSVQVEGDEITKGFRMKQKTP